MRKSIFNTRKITYPEVGAVIVIIVILCFLLIPQGDGKITYGKEVPIEERRILEEIALKLIDSNRRVNFTAHKPFVWKIANQYEWLQLTGKPTANECLQFSIENYSVQDYKNRRLLPVILLRCDIVVIAFIPMSQSEFEEILKSKQKDSSSALRRTISERIESERRISLYDGMIERIRRVDGYFISNLLNQKVL